MISNTRLRELRRQLVGDVTGTVVEIGAGRGENLADLPRDIRWIGTEPDPRRCRELARRAREQGRDAPIPAPAEALPLPAGTADVVLATLVFCSVRDLAQAMREARRVLRPDGRLVFVEHVIAASRTKERLVQRALTPLTIALDHNCHLTRDPVAAARAAGFRPVRCLQHDVTGRLPGMAVPFVLYEGVRGDGEDVA